MGHQPGQLLTNNSPSPKHAYDPHITRLREGWDSLDVVLLPAMLEEGRMVRAVGGRALLVSAPVSNRICPLRSQGLSLLYQSRRPPTDRALLRGRRGIHMGVDAACQIEDPLDGGVDGRVQVNPNSLDFSCWCSACISFGASSRTRTSAPCSSPAWSVWHRASLTS